MEFMVSIFNFIYVSLNYNNCLEAVYIVKSKDPTNNTGKTNNNRMLPHPL